MGNWGRKDCRASLRVTDGPAGHSQSWVRPQPTPLRGQEEGETTGAPGGTCSPRRGRGGRPPREAGRGVLPTGAGKVASCRPDPEPSIPNL